MSSYRVWRAVDAVTLGPLRRRRRMARQLRDLHSTEQGPLSSRPSGPRDWSPPEPSGSVVRLLSEGTRGCRAPGQTRSERARSITAAVIVLVALVLLIPLAQRQLLPDAVRAAEWPVAAGDQQDQRLLPVPAAPVGSGGYEIVRSREDGEPVRYDPCRPIHYVINPAGSPARGTALIRSAVARASAASGLVFTYDGVTHETPSDDRDYLQPGRYGDRWAPVLIAWSTAAQEPDLAGYIAGLGGSQSAAVSPETEHYVTGLVVLDSEDLTWRRGDQRARAAARAVVLHEVGHLLGLGHVNDPGQLMYSEPNPGVTDYADGDLRGLSRAGSGSCYPAD